MTPREVELTEQLEHCRRALAQAQRENELLRQKVELLVRRFFGSSSEKLDPAQLELLQLPDAPPAAQSDEHPPAASRPSARARQPRPPRLPRSEEHTSELKSP